LNPLSSATSLIDDRLGLVPRSRSPNSCKSSRRCWQSRLRSFSNCSASAIMSFGLISSTSSTGVLSA